MKLTAKQAHVLDNIDRVVPLERKLNTFSARERYQLDGIECTAQITGLTVRKLIRRHANGLSRRFDVGNPAKVRVRVGERQSPLPGSMDMIRASLSSPADLRPPRPKTGGNSGSGTGPR